MPSTATEPFRWLHQLDGVIRVSHPLDGLQVLVSDCRPAPAASATIETTEEWLRRWLSALEGERAMLLMSCRQ